MKFLPFTALVLAAAPASAVIVTSSPGAPDPGPLTGQQVVANFDDALAAGVVNSVSGAVMTAPGSIGGVRAAPAGDASAYQSIGSGGSSTFDFSGFSGGRPLTSFSLYWGSVDRYNHVDIFNRWGQMVGSFGGAGLPRSDGNQSLGDSNRRVSFAFTPEENVSRVTLRSDSPAFEFDDVAAGAIPEPGTWAMLIAGFGMVGLAVRRRRLGLTA